MIGIGPAFEKEFLDGAPIGGDGGVVKWGAPQVVHALDRIRVPCHDKLAEFFVPQCRTLKGISKSHATLCTKSTIFSLREFSGLFVCLLYIYSA